MKGTTQVIKLKNTWAPPESFETICLWRPQLPKNKRISRGIVSWEGGLSPKCNTYKDNMYGGAWSCVHTSNILGNFLVDTFFGRLCQRNLQACGIVHTRKCLRGPTLICSHTKNPATSIDFFDLVSAKKLHKKLHEKLLVSARLKTKGKLKWSELSSQRKDKFCKYTCHDTSKWSRH